MIKGNTFSLKHKQMEEKKERVKLPSLRHSRSRKEDEEKPFKATPYYQFIVGGEGGEAKGMEHRGIDISRNIISSEDYNMRRSFETATAENQTDEFIPRPFLPYIPAKIGLDAGTQVEPEELRELLFRFDVEVSPLLEVIVSKTIDQAILEIEREDELLAIFRQTKDYERAAFQEAETVKLLEAKLMEERLLLAKALEEQRVLVEKERQLERKIGAYVCSSQVIAPLLTPLLDSLMEGEWRSFITNPMEAFLKDVIADVGLLLDKRMEAAFAIEAMIVPPMPVPEPIAVKQQVTPPAANKGAKKSPLAKQSRK